MENPQCPQCREYEKVIEALQCKMHEMQELFESEIKTLKAEISCLREHISKNSRNSSKPPSADGLSKPTPHNLRVKSGRRPGGQKGHKGETLKQRENPDKIEVHQVNVCEHCGQSLEDVGTMDMEKRQVFDIPPLEIEVTEHRAERKCCPSCGHVSTATFPEGVNAPVQYGPHIQSLCIYLQQYQLLPYERTQELMEDIFSVSMSTGTLANMSETCSEGIRDATDQIKAMIRGAAIAHFDESGVSVNGPLQWLHTASTSWATCYDIHPKRGSEAMDEIGILPMFQGRAVHDFWKPYLGYGCAHALCNAHLLRELIFLHEEQKQVWAKEMIDHLMMIKAVVDENSQSTEALSARQIRTFEKAYWRIVEKGKEENPYGIDPHAKKKRGRPKRSKAQNLLSRLETYSKEVLAFMYDFRVPFDNNLSERDIRMIKLRMKISGTFRSEAGSQIFCRIRSYISTARKNTVNVIQAIQDALAGHPFIPSPGT